MNVIRQLDNRQVGRKRIRGWDFPLRTKRFRAAMEDSDMKGKESKDKVQGYMIPGVDGRLRFGFPMKVITILRYVDYFTLSSPAGGVMDATSTKVIRMNNVFDPDAATGGHQPMYSDTYAGIYDQYRVLGSRLKATFMPRQPTAAAQSPYIIGINGSDNTAQLSFTPFTRAEQSDAYHEYLNTQDGPRTLTWNFSPQDKLSIEADEDTNSALVNQSPVEDYNAHVWFADISGSASSLNLGIEVEYTVEYFKLKQQVGS